MRQYKIKFTNFFFFSFCLVCIILFLNLNIMEIDVENTIQKYLQFFPKILNAFFRTFEPYDRNVLI